MHGRLRYEVAVDDHFAKHHMVDLLEGTQNRDATAVFHTHKGSSHDYVLPYDTLVSWIAGNGTVI